MTREPKRSGESQERREKGEGSIYRRKNRSGKVIGWLGAYTVEDEYGAKRKTVYAKSKKEAKALLAQAIARRDAGYVYDAGNLKVGEYLVSWLRDTEGGLKVSSYRRYEHSVRYHLSPALGALRLSRLSPAHVQVLYRDKLSAGLSARSVIHLHEALRRALNRAVKLGLIPHNPCDAAESPRAPKTVMRPLDRGQSLVFLRAARGTRFEALFVLAITTGMRQGELLGLRWQDVDLDGARVRVSRSFVAWGGRGKGASFVEPKSVGSRRVVSLTPLAVVSLRKHQREMRKIGLYGEGKPVFSSAAGTPVRPPNVVRYHFKPLLKRAELPDIRFHDLRHTAATLLLGRGVHPKIVQELLGHASIQLTLDTYSHFLPDMQGAATDAMQAALEQPVEPVDDDEGDSIANSGAWRSG